MNHDTIVEPSAGEGKRTDIRHARGVSTRSATERNPPMASLSHTTPTAPAPTISRPRVWAWPLAVILGFPIGGYIANLTIGAVDSLGAALAGGLVAGAVVGAAQWLALRRLVPWIWIAATSIGMAAGLTLGAALVDYGIGRVDLMVMGAVTGAIVGGLQALVLARQGISGRPGGP